MASSTCCSVGVPGACCPTSFRPGAPSITTFVNGNAKGSGIRFCTPCECGCEQNKAERKSRVPRSLTVNPSKPARFGVRKRASIWGKKIWGRKRHALVDTQGNLLEVKVTGAEISDQEGRRALLGPLKDLLPRVKVIWGDSHYEGTFLTWASLTLGWTIQTLKALTVPKRGRLVPEGEEVDWEELFP